MYALIVFYTFALRGLPEQEYFDVEVYSEYAECVNKKNELIFILDKMATNYIVECEKLT